MNKEKTFLKFFYSLLIATLPVSFILNNVIQAADTTQKKPSVSNKNMSGLTCYLLGPVHLKAPDAYEAVKAIKQLTGYLNEGKISKKTYEKRKAEIEKDIKAYINSINLNDKSKSRLILAKNSESNINYLFMNNYLTDDEYAEKMKVINQWLNDAVYDEYDRYFLSLLEKDYKEHLIDEEFYRVKKQSLLEEIKYCQKHKITSFILPEISSMGEAGTSFNNKNIDYWQHRLDIMKGYNKSAKTTDENEQNLKK